MNDSRPHLQLVFEKQWLHVICLVVLLIGLILLSSLDQVRAGSLWGINSLQWMWLQVAIAVTHQVYVLVCWRIQLHGNWVTKMFGSYGFPAYAVGFSILGIARVGFVFITAISNCNTISIEHTILKLFSIIVLIPAIYLFYSVKRYFGFKRAFGIDHFDDSYRSLPFVRRGIYRFTRNGMYIYGFLILWAPALWWASMAAICAAGFNHLYIWVHYYATELPDMEHIYGKSRVTTNI